VKKSQPQKRKKNQRSFIIYSQLAFQMLVVILVGVFLGLKLDEIYPNQYSLFTLIFGIFSILLSIYYTIIQVTKNE
jgi:F0F1-type ATP synthase assembly protein I